jgi:hypothetical protein
MDMLILKFMKKNHNKIEYEKDKVNSHSMYISEKRLSEFINLFKAKTGVTLTESEALERAEILLRSISIFYKPISMTDYSSALAKKMFIKTKKV